MITVIEYKIEFNYTGYPNWTAPRIIRVNMDENTLAFSVEIRDASNNLLESPATGPSLFGGTNGHAVQITPAPLYGYCDGTTLRQVTASNSFPYASWIASPNHISCQVAPVCDLEISNSVSITPATAPDATDGAFTVTATSSNGTIRFSLDPNFDYTTGGNTTGVFSGLLPSTYLVYAKDAVGCQDTLSVTIPVTTVYNPKLRGEYNVKDNFDTRIDIEERGFTGSVTPDIKFGPTPIVVEYEECTRYTPFIGSRATITLLEETEGQYAALFGNDDRKYKLKYYKFISGVWQLKWVGYLIPGFYRQSFVRTYNNYVEFVASDQIGNLKEEEFRDINDNIIRGEISQIKGIAEILKKTDLNLSIRSADNLFDAGMTDEDTDDPLAQAFFDSRIFLEKKNQPKKCDECLEHIIKVKSGLQLFQTDGYWWLMRSEMAVGVQEYREFNYEGEYVSNGVYNPIVHRVDINGTGVVWRDNAQQYYFDQNYGKYILTHTLSFDDNLIDEGAFEEEDIIDLGDGNKGIKNWNIQINQPGLKYGLAFVENKESKGAFYLDFQNVFANQTDNLLYSTEIPIENGFYGGLIKFSFEYNTIPYYMFPWVRIGWQLRVYNNDTGNYLYYKPESFESFGGWSDTETINDIYVNKYNEFQKFELTEPMPPYPDLQGTIRIAFFVHNHRGKDFQSLAALKAVSTDGPNDVPVGKRYIVYDGVDTMHFYELEFNRDPEASPDVLRADDFETVSNPKIWRLKGSYTVQNALTKTVYFDNVKLTYIHNTVGLGFHNPPETASYSKTVSKFNKHTYEEEFLLGDLPEMPNGQLLYRGWLRLADGTPTSGWRRKGIGEAKNIMSVNLEDREAQLSDPIERIEGAFSMKNVFLSFGNAINDLNGNRYLITKYILEDKANRVTVMLDRTAVGGDGEPPVNLGAYSQIAYSNAYKIS